MSMVDLIHALDRQQGAVDASRCPNGGAIGNKTEHGRLTAHVSGSMLVCGKCDYMVPAVDPRS